MLNDLGNFIGSKLQSLFDSNITDATIDKIIEDICTNLISSNVNPKYIVELRKKMKDQIKNETMQSNTNKAKLVQNIIFKNLVDFMDPKTQSYKVEKGKSNVVVFVGLQGCGKTTSICKYANFYKKKGFKVGIVCADTFRAGAFDQIKQNAEKIKVPFYGSGDSDPVKVAKEGVSKFRRHDFELILVDTSGRHTQEDALFEEMKNLVSEIHPNNIVFVMDAGIGQSAEEQALGFKEAVNVGGIILTKIDGASKAGGALSSVAATRCPIEFVGTGEGMDDIEVFNAHRFISKLIGMGDVEGLVEKMSEMEIDGEGLTRKLVQGGFTLRDFKQFLTQICSMGPLTNVLKMIPGMGNIEIPDENKFQKCLYVFDSMSAGELDSCGEQFTKQPTRLIRVARGSGMKVEDVSEVLHSFKTMSLMAKKMMSIPGVAQMFGLPEKKNPKMQNTKLPSSLMDVLDSLN